LSIDPALDITGEPYTYADDNPLNHSDPTGRYWLKVGLAVVGGTALVIGTVIVLGVTSPIWIGVGVFVAVAGGITVAAVCIYAAYESVFKPLPPPE
jgi:hypothetical protein